MFRIRNWWILIEIYALLSQKYELCGFELIFIDQYRKSFPSKLKKLISSIRVNENSTKNRAFEDCNHFYHKDMQLHIFLSKNHEFQSQEVSSQNL